jgi:hypothetical protein
MPHSMFGTRGEIRFRGKNSPRFRREAAQKQKEEILRGVAQRALRAAEIAKEELARERRPVFAKVKERVKGFATRLFGRKTG